MSYFFQPEINTHPFLEDEEFVHCTRVLRKKPGDEIDILDGKGGVYRVTIKNLLKNKCELAILSQKQLPKKSFYTHLAISPTKSMDRMEWMVEKVAELGIDEITFIQTSNSERPKINLSRLEKKAISALKQSKNGYLTQINPLIRFFDFIKNTSPESQKYIAVVEDKLPYFAGVLKANAPCLILIGPEGDFSNEEQAQALQHAFKKISLGRSVLRTETAGLIACHFVNVMNSY